MKKIVLLAAVIPMLFSATVFSQKKKDIKKYGIKSVTETTASTVNGKEGTTKDAYKAFDKNGNIIESIDYYNDGTIKRKETAKFDKYGNKLEEIIYEPAKRKTDAPAPSADKNIKHVTKYNSNNDKTEETEYDASGKVMKKEAYSYNTNGDKVIEITLDTEGKLKKKVLYTYDKRGLRVERKTYNGENVLMETKKYDYQFN